MGSRDKISISFLDMIFLVGISIAAVLIPVVVTKLHFIASEAVVRSPFQLIVAILVALLAIFFVGFNLYTSFFRPWMYRRAHGDYSGYQYVSGAPAIGSILICISTLLLPSSPWIGGLLMTLYLIDPGGIHFFVFAVLRDALTKKEDAEPEFKSEVQHNINQKKSSSGVLYP